MSVEIDYSKLDTEVIPMVKLFNALGMETMASCEGHDHKSFGSSDFIIIFEHSLSDEKMNWFISRVQDYMNVNLSDDTVPQSLKGWLLKRYWVMTDGWKLKCKELDKTFEPFNWVYLLKGNISSLNRDFVKEDYKLFRRVFEKELFGLETSWD